MHIEWMHEGVLYSISVGSGCNENTFIGSDRVKNFLRRIQIPISVAMEAVSVHKLGYCTDTPKYADSNYDELCWQICTGRLEIKHDIRSKLEKIDEDKKSNDVVADLQKLLEIREGVKYVVYLDSLKKPTGGIGHLIQTEDGLKVGDKIEKEQVKKWFRQDSRKALLAAQKQAKEASVTDPDFIVYLASVNFQLGTG